MKKEISPTKKALKYMVSYSIAVCFLLPIIWMLFVSLKSEGFRVSRIIDWFTPPYSLANYFSVIQRAPIFRWMFNSFIVASSATLLVIFLSSLAAFYIAP